MRWWLFGTPLTCVFEYSMEVWTTKFRFCRPFQALAHCTCRWQSDLGPIKRSDGIKTGRQCTWSPRSCFPSYNKRPAISGPIIHSDLTDTKKLLFDRSLFVWTPTVRSTRSSHLPASARRVGRRYLAGAEESSRFDTGPGPSWRNKGSCWLE